MTTIRAVLLSAMMLACSGCATTAERAAAPQLAITVDDLPVHGPLPRDAAPLEVATEMLTALKAAGVRDAYGFVNGEWTVKEPETAAVLSAWRAAGYPLANHGWSHRSVDQATAAEYEHEISRNEPLLERLDGGTDWRWFRYPYLHEGQDPSKRDAVRSILARRGYRIASVTMDFSDWQWAAPYARCRDSRDEASIAELETLYLASARETADFSRRLSRGVYGRDIPYVLLMHVGAFSARMMPRLLALYRDLGFRFVSLPQAEADPVYAADLAPAAGGRATNLEQLAAGKGVQASRTDYAALLDRFCRPAVSG
jgi:peptidoglycan/xylan/chitin deacetylase (PgdA/CDA1 family)